MHAKLEAIGRGLFDVQQRLWELEMTVVDRNRRMVYNFMELPTVVQLEIATSLGLTASGDESLSQTERQTQYFRRAQRSGLLERLREAITMEVNS